MKTRLKSITTAGMEMILHLPCRHPNADERPSFKDLVETLTVTPNILEIPDKIIAAHPDFQVPGGNLDIGENVYKEMQHIYS